jgi:DNA-binding NtrC family response regulator
MSHGLAPSDSDMATAFDKVETVPALAAPYASLTLLDPAGEVRPLDDLEAEAIRFALTHYRGQMSEVARRLRIGRSTLYRKLDALGIANEKPAEDRVAFE